MAGPYDWNELRITDDRGEVVVAPCIAFTMCFDATNAPVLLDFYERTMEAVGPLLTHYQAESMKRRAKITPRARTMVPTWIKKPAELKFYYAEFRGAEDIHGASFEVYFRDRPPLTPAQQERSRKNLPILVQQGLTTGTGIPTSTFRVTLPIDHPLAAPDRFARWALDFEAVKHGEFVTGGCDYSVNYDYGRGGVEPEVRSLCMRYPGLDWIHPSIHLWLFRYEQETNEFLPLVKRAGWITLVNERSAEYLGGEAKLADALKGDPTVRIHRLAHGLALQAGDAPRLGDRSRLDIPYRSVAAAIRRARIERVGSVGYEDEWMKEWLGMLDEPLPGEQR